MPNRDHRTILPRYVHIRSQGPDGQYLASESSRNGNLTFSKPAQGKETLFEAIPVDNHQTTLTEVFKRRAQSVAGERDHSHHSLHINMYYFRAVDSQKVIAITDESANRKESVELQHSDNKVDAVVFRLERTEGNTFYLAVSPNGDPSSIYYLTANSESVVRCTPSAGGKTLMTLEPGMALQITDVSYKTDEATVTFLPPTVLVTTLDNSNSSTKRTISKKITYSVLTKGIWRNGQGYGIGPQAGFRVGIPYWNGTRIEVGSDLEYGRNAIYGDVGTQREMSVTVSATVPAGKSVQAAVTINRLELELKWKCKAHVIWHNSRDTLVVGEEGIYTCIQSDSPIVDYYPL